MHSRNSPPLRRNFSTNLLLQLPHQYLVQKNPLCSMSDQETPSLSSGNVPAASEANEETLVPAHELQNAPEADEVIETTTTTVVEVFYEDLPADYNGPYETTTTVEEVVTVESIELLDVPEDMAMVAEKSACNVASAKQGQPAAVDAIIVALVNNSSEIVSLNLKDNSRLVREQGLLLVEALAGNTFLKTLDLSGTEITEAVALALAKLLETDAVLVAVNLEGNNLTNTVLESFAQVISLNTTLTSLRLGCLPFASLSVEQAIAAAIENNRTLLTFTFAFEDVSCRIAVDKALARNNTHHARNLQNAPKEPKVLSSVTTTSIEEIIEDLPESYDGPFDATTTTEEIVTVEKTVTLLVSELPADILAAATAGAVEIVIEEISIIETSSVVTGCVEGEVIEEIVEVVETVDIHTATAKDSILASREIQVSAVTSDGGSISLDAVAAREAIAEENTGVKLPVAVGTSTREVIVEEVTTSEIVTNLPIAVDASTREVIVEEVTTSEIVTNLPIAVDASTREVIVEEVTTSEIVTNLPIAVDASTREVIVEEVEIVEVVEDTPLILRNGQKEALVETITTVETVEVLHAVPASFVETNVREIQEEEVVVVEVVGMP
ncbi:hypothetical protein BDR26DRAFT_413199 [Obelidium mucronatum]|nr:hypothetical protein BDR26DRAFT_413199 [Obelidium mucronatum]